MVSEIAKCACVTWRAQPPFGMRFGALLNDAQNCGRSPTSVGGGDCAEGNWLPNTRFRGPGSLVLAAFLALIAPSGGSSGSPKDAARELVAAVTNAPVAVAVSMFRLEIIARPLLHHMGSTVFRASARSALLGWSPLASLQRSRNKRIGARFVSPRASRDRQTAAAFICTGKRMLSWFAETDSTIICFQASFRLP